MKQTVSLILFLTLNQISFSQRTTIDFDKDWEFNLGNDTTATWRTLSLPHDWSIEGAFSESNPATTQGGAMPGGIGWYRKTFILPSANASKNVFIEFDGIYRNSEVWINGHWLGKRPNGYISFQYDLTPYIKQFPAKNLIVVKVDNSEQPNSRWYSGSGIYRDVRLVIKNKIAVDHWGVFISTPSVSKSKAVIDIEASVSGNKMIKVQADLFAADNKKVGSIPLLLSGSKAQGKFVLSNPELWSTGKPYLYKAITRVIDQNGNVLDQNIISFGIRHFYFDAVHGFFLNDQPLKILGVCDHHDLGALGAAVNARAIERQLQLLKAMGCNAIRTSHNPPAPVLLDLCDKMGFLVIDEAFDMWKKKKNKYDYSSDFDQWHKQDLEDMVRRDRNHPSVFMWSIGNEIREQFDSSGIALGKELTAIVKSLDTTRPVTCALSEWDPAKNFIYQSGALDVVGLNYHQEMYRDFPLHYPNQKFIATETMSALETRGHYDQPSDTILQWPQRSQKFADPGNPDLTVSSYDQVSAYWGSTHETTWKIIKKYDYLSGLFTWSGFDYLGEPTPYPWPARSSYFGIIDLAGFPKDIYYMYQSEWTDKPVLHLFPHWNWKPGQLVDVWAYYNNADEVELYLNGRSLGTRKKNNDDLHVMWRVPFEPGILKAISRKNGKTVLAKEIHTAGQPAKIELIADRRVLNANGKDLSFVTARVLDRDGNLVTGDDHNIHFSITGAGKIEATDNGYEADLTSFKSTERKCWKGMALAIIKSSEKKGNITLKAASGKLTSAVLSLKNQ